MTTTTITDGEMYQSGSYTGDVAAFNVGTLVEGVDYQESITFNDDSITDGFAINWDFPAESTPSVRSFLGVAFGNYCDGNPQTPIPSSTLSQLTTLTATTDFTLSGDTAGFNVIDDIFLTSVAGGDNPMSDEVEVFLHTPANPQAWISTLTRIGSVVASGITWNVSVGTNPKGKPDYVFAPANYRDLTNNSIDIKTLLQYLVSTGSVSGSLFFNGMELGVETESGAGSMNVSSFNVNYSTSTPTPTVTIRLVDQTGATVSGQEYTDNENLTGTADANSTVSIYDSSTLVATVVANAQGVWTYDPSLSNGYHKVIATETNSVGNSGSASVVIQLSTNPLNLSDNITYVSGQGQNGVYTIDPQLTGWTAPNATVSLQDGTTSLGQVTANSSGYWSYQTSELSQGSHDIIATARDIYGRTAIASTSFIYATSTPTVTIGLVDQTGATVNGQEYTYNAALTGTADANSTVDIYNGSTLIGTAAANARGVWTYDPSLTNGYHDLIATETNSYGLTGSASVVMQLNATTLNLSENITYVSGQGQNGVYTIDPQVTGWTAPNATVSLKDGTTSLGQVAANSSGYWSYQTSDLSQGSHDIIANVDDIYGRTASASTSFIYATSRPTVTIGLVDQTGATVIGQEYTYNAALTGTADANSTVDIYNGSTLTGTAAANAHGVWTYDPSLTNGYHDLIAEETNSYGLTGSASEVIELATNTLNLSENITYVSGQGQNGIYTIDPQLTGWTAPNATISLQDGTQLLGQVAANSSGYWSYQTSNLSLGSHDIIANADDIYGRTANASTKFTFA